MNSFVPLHLNANPLPIGYFLFPFNLATLNHNDNSYLPVRPLESLEIIK